MGHDTVHPWQAIALRWGVRYWINLLRSHALSVLLGYGIAATLLVALFVSTDGGQDLDERSLVNLLARPLAMAIDPTGQGNFSGSFRELGSAVYRALWPYLSLVTLVRTIVQEGWDIDFLAPCNFTLGQGLRALGYWFGILGMISLLPRIPVPLWGRVIMLLMLYLGTAFYFGLAWLVSQAGEKLDRTLSPPSRLPPNPPPQPTSPQLTSPQPTSPTPSSLATVGVGVLGWLALVGGLVPWIRAIALP